jgi:hypothetical protein
MSHFLKKHKFDFILVGSIIFIAVLGIFLFSLFRTEGAYAVVTIDGKQVKQFPLDKDATETLHYNDEYNILIIENGTARIEEASCPDKLCVNQHKIKYNGETLVCLPNKTTVKIVSEVDSDTDFIS